MPKTETGLLIFRPQDHCLKPVEIEFKNYYDRDHAVAEWLAQKMKELKRRRKFSAEELRTAPWMPPAADIFSETSFCSLGELSEAAYRIIHANGTGLTPRGKKLKEAMRLQRQQSK